METPPPRWTLVKSVAALRATDAPLLWLQDIPDLEDLAPLDGRTDLEGLRIVLCPRFASLRGIGRMVALESLDLSHCAEIESLEPIADLTRLRELTLFGHKRLVSLHGVEVLREPTALKIEYCPALTDIEALRGLTTLTSLSLDGSESLRDLRPLEGLTQLRSLRLANCKSITSLDGLRPLTALESLDLTGCASLESLGALGEKPRLRKLVLDGAAKLRSLDGLHGVPALESLRATSCLALEDIHALAGAPALAEVNLSTAVALHRAESLAAVPQLTQLDLGYTKIDALPRLPRTLRKLVLAGTPMMSLACIDGCDSVEELSLEQTEIVSPDEVRRALASPRLRRVELPSKGPRVLPLEVGGAGAGSPPWIEQARALLARDRPARSQRWIGLAGDADERAAFSRVIESPSDRDARVAYAQLLRARGEVRGEFVEADLVTMDGSFASRSDRARALLRAHQAEWFGDLWQCVLAWNCGGGFMQAATMRVDDAARHGEWFTAHTPLRALTLADAKDEGLGRTLWSTGWTRAIESITYFRAPAAVLNALGRSAHLHALQTLRAEASTVSLGAAQSLATGSLGSLRELFLAGATFEPGAIASLAALPLHVLDLSGAAVTVDDLVAIAGSPAMGSLRRLVLDGRFAPHAGIEALAASDHLVSLEEIVLSGSDYDRPTINPAPLFSSAKLSSLRVVVTEAYWSTEPSGDFTVASPHGPVIHRVMPGLQYY